MYKMQNLTRAFHHALTVTSCVRTGDYFVCARKIRHLGKDTKFSQNNSKKEKLWRC